MTTTLEIEVRYPDCDMMGIVHHAVYPIWYEMARMDFFAKIGFSFSAMHKFGIDPPMVCLNMTYQRPVRYPGSVTIKTRLISYAPKKLELKYEAYDGDALVATGTSFHIWTGPDMKSLNMQQEHPEIYARFQAVHEP
jgi:acyl-CoA thioester hydrolase